MILPEGTWGQPKQAEPIPGGCSNTRGGCSTSWEHGRLADEAPAPTAYRPLHGVLR